LGELSGHRTVEKIAQALTEAGCKGKWAKGEYKSQCPVCRAEGRDEGGDDRLWVNKHDGVAQATCRKCREVEGYRAKDWTLELFRMVGLIGADAPRETPKAAGATPPPPSGPTLSFVTIEAFGEGVQKDVPWLVKDILVQGSTSIATGLPKVGKTHYAITTGLAVASGTPWQFGALHGEVKTFDTVQGRVLFLSLDQSAGVTYRRLLSHAPGACGTPLPDDAKDQFLVLNPPRIVDRLQAGEVWFDVAVQRLHEALVRLAPKLVIIDTMQRFCRIAKTNDYEVPEQYMARIADLASSTNTHIMLLHHGNKTGEQNPNESSMGNAAILSGCDTIVGLYLVKAGPGEKRNPMVKAAGRYRLLETGGREVEPMRLKAVYEVSEGE